MEQLRRDPTVDIAIVLGHVARTGPQRSYRRGLLYFRHLRSHPLPFTCAGLRIPRRAVRRERHRPFRLQKTSEKPIRGIPVPVCDLADPPSSREDRTGILVNHPPVMSDLWSLWKPEGQLWLLPFLMIATALAVLLRPWRPNWMSRSGMFATAMISVLARGIDGPSIGTRGTSLFVFFFAGAAIGYQRIRQSFSALKTSTLGATALITVALFVLLVNTTVAAAPTVDDPTRTFPEVLWVVPASILGVLSVLAISALLPRASPLGWLAFVGQRSLEVFLAHIIAASGTRMDPVVDSGRRQRRAARRGGDSCLRPPATCPLVDVSVAGLPLAVRITRRTTSNQDHDHELDATMVSQDRRPARLVPEKGPGVLCEAVTPGHAMRPRIGVTASHHRRCY